MSEATFVMDKEQFSYTSASKIYNYYYTLAIKEFQHTIADRLAKIPADYVYNSLQASYPNCFIDENCCLEYCNEILDSDFDKLSPEFKRMIYDKSFNVNSAISDGEINLRLKSKRRIVKNKFFESYKKENENNLNRLTLSLNKVSLKRKSNNLENILKELKLN